MIIDLEIQVRTFQIFFVRVGYSIVKIAGLKLLVERCVRRLHKFGKNNIAISLILCEGSNVFGNADALR